jgi:serine/threonine protein kinase
MDRKDTTIETSLFHCPITKEKFCDPVVAEDGHTYERDAIIKWLETDGKGTSPITRKPLNVSRLIPNLLVKQLIDDQFETTLRNTNYQFKLDDDITQQDFLFENYGKLIYTAKWTKKVGGPSIIVMTILSARAEKEAMFYVEMSKHAHIVRTYGLVDNPNKQVMLVQERAQHGSLLQLLRGQKQPLSETILNEIFIQIADGMSFLAHNNIAHGDLACRNILVFEFDEQNPEKILVKVTDFGLSRGSSIYQSTSTSASTTLNVIPYRYAAPEILQNPDRKEFYNEKSDMYSVGVLMWEAYFPGGKRPWPHINDDNEVTRRVINGERLEQPPTCSKEMWSLIQTSMLQKPNDRPTFAVLHRQLIELGIEIRTRKILPVNQEKMLPPNVKKALKAIKENSETISLSQTVLCDEEMKIIAEELKTNGIVRSLELSGNNLSDEGAIAIAEMLEVNKTINKVVLNENQISSEGAKRLARALTNNKTLVSLEIGNNPLFDDGIQAICEILKTNKTLRVLCVDGTQISIIGVKLLAEMLRTNKTLTYFAMGRNNITDDAAEFIAEALKVNASLTWLHLDSSDITDKGVVALANAVKVHRRKFDYFYIFPRCLITDHGKNALDAALRVNAANNV